MWHFCSSKYGVRLQCLRRSFGPNRFITRSESVWSCCFYSISCVQNNIKFVSSFFVYWFQQLHHSTIWFFFHFLHFLWEIARFIYSNHAFTCCSLISAFCLRTCVYVQHTKLSSWLRYSMKFVQRWEEAATTEKKNKSNHCSIEYALRECSTIKQFVFL